MNFEEYLQIYETALLCQTEQSKTFAVERDNLRIVCKKFPSPLERAREELAYRYLAKQEVIKIPSLFMFGDDFLEFQFIEKIREPTDVESIAEISKLYLKTLDDVPSFLLPRIDLSKEKIFHRLSYLNEEFAKSNIEEEDILERALQFMRGEYNLSSPLCVVHGDLKSLHCIPSSEGLYFIDFGLTAIANPWYDIAFLYMEKRNKTGILEQLAKATYENLGNPLNINEEQSARFLRSGIFYRSLYNLGFALRHRPQKTIERTKRELNEIMEKKI
ncbi:aminoglycoside phosphotransferase family protein [Candidatus Woesearchaeota archaeon]|nr:aminoglycoside phosphotransferase family protein [Candidatus Woesearchaeota archaeon]